MSVKSVEGVFRVLWTFLQNYVFFTTSQAALLISVFDVLLTLYSNIGVNLRFNRVTRGYSDPGAGCSGLFLFYFVASKGQI